MEEKYKNLPLRSGVGIVVLNKENKIFVAKRIDNKKNFWQMPQGGVDKGEDLYEAAGIDGANKLHKFIHVTFPHLQPILLTIILLDFIWTMQVFPLIWLTTGGGPLYSTEMLSTFTYKLAFSSYKFSLASASAFLVLLISLSVSIFYINKQFKRE